MILIFTAILLMGLLFLLFSIVKSPLFAPTMAVGLWGVYFLFNAILNQDFIFFSTGPIFILFALTLVSAGGIVGFYAKKYILRTSAIPNISQWQSTFTTWHYLAIFSITLTTMGLFGLIWYSFNEFQLLSNIFSILLLPQEFATDRYGGAQYLPMELKLLSYMIYPSALAVGALTGGKNWSWKTRFIPVSLALGYGMVYSSRTVVILTIVAMISSDLAVRVFNHRIQKNNIKNLLVLGTGMILVLPVIFIGLQWLRQGVNSELFMFEMIQIARSSMTGSISAFSQWIHEYDWLEYGWGRHTFAGPFELIGISTRVQGFFLEFSEVGITHINIYTAFRGLLQDYGFWGTSLFSFLLGLISSFFFFHVKNGSILIVPLLSMCYGWILFSPFVSLFVNNSILTGYIIFFLISFVPVQPQTRIIEKMAY